MKNKKKGLYRLYYYSNLSIKKLKYCQHFDNIEDAIDYIDRNLVIQRKWQGRQFVIVEHKGPGRSKIVETVIV